MHVIVTVVTVEIYFDVRNLRVFVPQDICHFLYVRKAF